MTAEVIGDGREKRRKEKTKERSYDGPYTLEERNSMVEGCIGVRERIIGRFLKSASSYAHPNDLTGAANKGLMEARDRFCDPNPKNFKKYAGRAMVNRIINYLRREARMRSAVINPKSLALARKNSHLLAAFGGGIIERASRKGAPSLDAFFSEEGRRMGGVEDWRFRAPDARLEREEELNALSKMVSPKYRSLLVFFCDFPEASYADAAAALEIPEGTVMSRLFRLRKQLEGKLSIEGRMVNGRRTEPSGRKFSQET